MAILEIIILGGAVVFTPKVRHKQCCGILYDAPAAIFYVNNSGVYSSPIKKAQPHYITSYVVV